MRAPEFWHQRKSPIAAVLAPLGALYDAASRWRASLTRPVKLARPVLCVGNLTAGGAGKTPAALALAAWLHARGRHPHFLTRGYGGKRRGPLRIDPARHGFQEVGDEPLLLAAAAPTWLARDRVAGAQAACEAGADLVIMDDGLQNPALVKDISLVVVDGGYGFGNGHVIPAGPLRETPEHGLARAHGVVLIGEDVFGLGRHLGRRLPVIAARLVPDGAAQALIGKRVLAFAGIGRPEKFFASLRELGCTLVGKLGFADHHAYEPDEIERIVEKAKAEGAVPVTTEKDFVRLPVEARDRVSVLRVSLAWRDENALDRLLRPVLDAHG